MEKKTKKSTAAIGLMDEVGSTQNYILMPIHSTTISRQNTPNVSDFLSRLSTSAQSGKSISLGIRNMPQKSDSTMEINVLDSIEETGAKLVSLSEDQLTNLKFSYPGLRILPEILYYPAFKREKVSVKIKKVAAAVSPRIRVTDSAGNGVAQVTVVAFTDFSSKTGAQGKTDNNGYVTLQTSSSQIEQLYVYPDFGYWGVLQKNITLTNNYVIKLTSIDLSKKDVLRFFYDTVNWPAVTSKVTVGVIDTGVGPHNLLNVVGGLNCVSGEDPADYGDNGEGHGTHVAGIIAASGSMPGVATGVEIRSYRVFPKTGEGASNFSIIKAIKQAIKDKCDFVNMSLGQASPDDGINTAIKDAYDAGVICFAANGNDSRSPVSYPAAYSLCMAISAMGRKGTFPNNSVQTGAVKAPYGSDKSNFIADFSNVGTETDMTAPGVGIISTYPGGNNDRHAVMDGTSMATPAATGMAARLLSTMPSLLSLPRNATRANEITKFLSGHLKDMGFGPTFEGKGMLFLP